MLLLGGDAVYDLGELLKFSLFLNTSEIQMIDGDLTSPNPSQYCRMASALRLHVATVIHMLHPFVLFHSELIPCFSLPTHPNHPGTRPDGASPNDLSDH